LEKTEPTIDPNNNNNNKHIQLIDKEGDSRSVDRESHLINRSPKEKRNVQREEDRLSDRLSDRQRDNLSVDKDKKEIQSINKERNSID
jgi:hypothetical protein